jgi:anhydro-N-acetylmuramic acid kinase
MPLYAGLMSGTSLDGIDGVLVDLEDDGGHLRVALIAHRHAPYPDDLRAELLSLNRSGTDELHRAAVAQQCVVDLGAGIVQQLLDEAGVECSRVRAIGSHGQTVRHRPPVRGQDFAYTIQLDDGARLAEATGIDVVCDFRRRDVAAGGQGAPLVPAFHAALFARPGEHVAALNLGGFANLTLLRADGSLSGFDCGPANVLLDAWCERHLQRRYDADGRWAAGGRVDPALLASMRADPYFALPPPKSTGRDQFHLSWLDDHLRALAAPPAAADVQATLVELTAQTVADDLRRHAPLTSRLWVCGGGADNGTLVAALARRLAGVTVCSTAAAGIAPTAVEPAAFAWLAHAHLERLPGNCPEVTGARGARVLGAHHPAR